MYHPANVYPVLVGVGIFPYVLAYVTLFVHLDPLEVNVYGLAHVELVHAFPPFTSNVTVYVLAVHCAYADTVLVTFDTSTVVELVAVVYHPVFLSYPTLDTLGASLATLQLVALFLIVQLLAILLSPPVKEPPLG